MASESARAAILSSVLPVKFWYTTACRSLVLAFFEAVHFATSTLVWAILSLVLPVMFRHITAYRSSPTLAFSAAIYFAMKRSAPCSAVLHHPPSSWSTVIVHWSALIQKALRSSRRHLTHSFSCPPTQPAPFTYFGSLASSMRATNPVNRIR